MNTVFFFVFFVFPSPTSHLFYQNFYASVGFVPLIVMRYMKHYTKINFMQTHEYLSCVFNLYHWPDFQLIQPKAHALTWHDMKWSDEWTHSWEFNELKQHINRLPSMHCLSSLFVKQKFCEHCVSLLRFVVLTFFISNTMWTTVKVTGALTPVNACN